MTYNEVLNIFKNHFDISESPTDIEIDVKNKNLVDKGIKKLKIGLIDIISQENILLNMEENEKFIFIVQKRNDTLFFSPYTPDSFNGTIEVMGLVEQTTRLPIVLKSDISEDKDLHDFPEDCWTILSRQSFMTIFN